MISCTTWVPRGYAAEFPVQYELDDQELDRISKFAQLRLDDARNDLENAENEIEGDDAVEEAGSIMVDEEGNEATKIALEAATNLIKSAVDDDDAIIKEYNLDNYDAEPDTEERSLHMFSNIKSLAYYKSNDEDPYIVLTESKNGQGDALEDEEKEELQIYDSDNLLLVTKTEDNLSHMEVCVYEESNSNLYVHHDILLPSFPLCVEWLDVRVGKTRTEENDRGNFAAIGTFEPNIEIWNLDVVDGMYPDAILGDKHIENQAVADAAEDKSKSKKDKKKKKISKNKGRELKANTEYHVDAVLTLSANRLHRNILASGSADKTVKLWDLSTQTCARSYSFHSDKVCTLSWHPEEGPVLLTGAYDRTAVVSDMRVFDAEQGTRRWTITSDVETVKWDPHNPTYFFVTAENGCVYYFDARNAGSKPLWTLQAHDSEVTTFDVNTHIKGLIATGSTDQTVKLWNINGNAPSLVLNRDLGVGKVFAASWLPDKSASHTLSVGGSNGVVQIWDTKRNEAVRMSTDEDDFEDEEEDGDE
ncbi:WD40-repeat-containing domain protein [Dipodascopsis uninucleata]